MTMLGLHTLRRQLPNSMKKINRTFSQSTLLLAKANENPYTNTILLPKTKFPLRAEAAKREHLFKDRCTKELYPWQVNKNCPEIP
jgi:isoleucyl-tRNA synthetase